MDNKDLNQDRTKRSLVIANVILMVIVGILVWLLLQQKRFEAAMFSHQSKTHNLYVEFLVYRGYRDADYELSQNHLRFLSADIWERSFQVGSLKVSLDPATLQSKDAVSEFGSIYNSHKARAAYRRLQQSSDSPAATKFLDGLEEFGVLSHGLRLGTQSTNIIDRY